MGKSKKKSMNNKTVQPAYKKATQKEVKEIKEKPIHILFLIFVVFTFLALSIVATASEFIKIEKTLNRFFMMTVVTVVLGTFLKAAYTMCIHIYLGSSNEIPTQAKDNIERYKTFNDLGVGFTIINLLFTMNVEFLLGLTIFITDIFFLLILTISLFMRHYR